MDNVQLRYIFDRAKTATDTQKGLLQIEVRKSKTNQRRLISTGIRLTKNQFSSKNGFTCKNHPNALAITGQAVSIFRKIEAFVLSKECVSLDDVKNWDKSKGGHSVVEFMKEQLSKSNPTRATHEHHAALIRQLEKFGKIKLFSDVTFSNIVEFDNWLKSNGVHENSTLNKRHSTLRSYIKKAIYMRICEKDPYFEFKMPPKKGKDPTFLEQNEIDKILNYAPANEKLQEVKDLFVFQIFTGMAFIDLMQFSKDYVSEMDGMKVVRSNRQKTDESFITLFLPEAEKIAEKYDYDLPKFPNQKYNFYLKVLGAGAELKKSLTSHVARHTFATYLLNKNIPLETVSRAMGHTSTKMTEHYAKMLGKKVVSDMKKLL
jgi:site-specific recombinase XerD